MIKSLCIENFKALQAFKVDLTQFNMLIGENSCGKSTILQALDFLCSIATRDIDIFLDERDWSFDELQSQFSRPEEPIAFSVEYSFRAKTYIWSISINQQDDQWVIVESIAEKNSNESFVSFGRGEKDYPLDFSQMNLRSSALKTIDVEKSERGNGVFAAPVVGLKAMLSSSSSFELLSPEKMRGRGSRGAVNSIGMGGEKLAAFIHGFPSKRKNDLSKRISRLIGREVKISTTTKGRPGWVDIYVEEIWDSTETSINKRYLSDGLLRILALSAILVGSERRGANAEGQNSLILLDEIEDGINPALAEELIADFKNLAHMSGYQVIVTSHSPVMVNYADYDDIVYLWRDDTGRVQSENLFHSEDMRKLLDIFNPGEVWLNYEKEDIVKMLREQKDESNE